MNTHFVTVTVHPGTVMQLNDRHEPFSGVFGLAVLVDLTGHPTQSTKSAMLAAWRSEAEVVAEPRSYQHSGRAPGSTLALYTAADSSSCPAGSIHIKVILIINIPLKYQLLHFT